MAKRIRENGIGRPFALAHYGQSARGHGYQPLFASLFALPQQEWLESFIGLCTDLEEIIFITAFIKSNLSKLFSWWSFSILQKPEG